MKLWAPIPYHDVVEGLHFLHITMPWGGVLSLYWECQGPIWWLPRFQISISKRRFRIGWLLIALGLGYLPLKERFKNDRSPIK